MINKMPDNLSIKLTLDKNKICKQFPNDHSKQNWNCFTTNAIFKAILAIENIR